ncbi:MAG: hypothetical protein GC136_06890 [Alphaproteobacteria bacterium]|nr:hypothetical protein [Alphaproteobacteria bacterium]
MLIIARHGNTFDPDEEPRRVGGRTDISLSESGRTQGVKLGEGLRAEGLQPDVIYTSSLKRTQETGTLAFPNAALNIAEFLQEIDYGDDEDKPESIVVARIGEKALKDWEEHNIVPQGWVVDKEAIIAGWRKLAEGAKGKNILAVTSNGIARFAPDALGVAMEVSTKIKTGAYCVFTFEGGAWICKVWNKRP